MNYPQQCYIVGKFVGVHPEQAISADFQKQSFAIDTEEKFNNIKVFEAHRTAVKDGIAQLQDFQKGDVVKVSFNLNCIKSKEGKWFSNIVAWKVQPFVPQDTDDFSPPAKQSAAPKYDLEADPQYTGNHAQTAVTAGSGDDLPF